MRGWFYLQEPSDTGPFACTFQLVSEGSHPVKDDSDPWPSDWYRLEQSVTLEQVEEKGVVMLTEVARFESHHDKPSSPGEAGHHLGTRERETLLKLVLGMAIEGYRFDPRAARNEAPAEIASDLAKHGMQLSDDTVRKWLKEAANSVLPGRPPNI